MLSNGRSRDFSIKTTIFQRYFTIQTFAELPFNASFCSANFGWSISICLWASLGGSEKRVHLRQPPDRQSSPLKCTRPNRFSILIRIDHLQSRLVLERFRPMRANSAHRVVLVVGGWIDGDRESSASACCSLIVRRISLSCSPESRQAN